MDLENRSLRHYQALHYFPEYLRYQLDPELLGHQLVLECLDCPDLLENLNSR